jgi:hypothetical protein
MIYACFDPFLHGKFYLYVSYAYDAYITNRSEFVWSVCVCMYDNFHIVLHCQDVVLQFSLSFGSMMPFAEKSFIA